jgi:DNA invertase Pin-like site-specific DNA recombinase
MPQRPKLVCHQEAAVIIGYARTSTVEQEAGLEGQERDLRAAGCEEVFSEKVSSVAARPQLEAAILHCRKGDVFVVTKPDRLARSTTNLLDLVDRMKAKGASLRILSMAGSELDTGSATGKLMLTMLAAVAEFERNLMLERQREGIRKAAEEGKYKGRAPTAQRQADEAERLKAKGMKPADIAAQLHISLRSYFRIVRAA